MRVAALPEALLGGGGYGYQEQLRRGRIPQKISEWKLLERAEGLGFRSRRRV